MPAPRNSNSGGETATAPVVVRNAQRKVRVNTRKLAEFARLAWQACDRISAKRPWPSAGISVVFVSDKAIAAVHDRFMGVSGPTDVITFQHGEIVISAETALRQAREYRSSLMRELQLYIVHGLLHLRGYDDKTSSGSREMERRQRSILRRLGS
jgi:probable rRNA maturation factor